MLNRRILRIKAMQYMYAFKQCKRANYHVSLSLIEDTYKPDLNAAVAPDMQQLALQREMTVRYFDALFSGKKLEETFSENIRDVAQEAMRKYEDLCRKDKNFLGKQLITTTEKIHDYYLLFFVLLSDLSRESERRAEKLAQTNQPAAASAASFNFARNRVVEILRNHDQFLKETQQKNLHWKEYQAEIRQWYKNLTEADEEFSAYQQLASTKFDDDKAIVSHLISLIFNDETIMQVLEEKDLNWTEDRKVIRSMLKKSIKSIMPEDAAPMELAELSVNWEEDKIFLTDLFKHVTENDDAYENIIAEHTKNWAVERITVVDHIIMKLAIAELIHFPSIPVKVTINEYIDISKNYSTPKSKQFVNGLIDVMANDLQKAGKVRKSGRGLIDNR